MSRKTSSKYSVWSILSVCSFGCSLFTLYKGIDKLTNYHHSEDYPGFNENVYVGGDAYNYIINGNYATAFFVLTTMFVLAAIGLMVLHYVSLLEYHAKTTTIPEQRKTVVSDELPDL